MPAKKASEAAKKDQLRVADDAGKSPERRMADTAVHPAVSAAATVLNFAKGTFGKLEITETVEALNDNVAAVKSGNLSGPEAMLVSQAHALNAIFTELARRSALNMGEYIEASEKYMRLALKAQAQCRATLETLGTLKNPPVVIARQANISAGPQQVNNGAAPRAEVSSNQPNKLLEQSHEPRLDPGAPRKAGCCDPALVPLEASHRA
ncbi:hypothetical protein GGQ97_000380 [Sphingomonas kaistensis]|uniref:Uncharacterized protein n=1 Tax=Sphingomonas kaistensis TaxID=298708 RepID=A0A7X5Y3Q3_9SPHN|nr:hypothetical protein [Sphingomonas kaistensis]NJC04587.1 hypothetical protein [Sphingomonas kaistensis]